MITELTPEQETQLKVYAKKWRAVGLSTEPANRPEAEKGVRLAYELAGLNPPKEIIWFDSPMKMLKAPLLSWARILKTFNITLKLPLRLDVGRKIGWRIATQAKLDVLFELKSAGVLWSKFLSAIPTQSLWLIRSEIGIDVESEVIYGQHDSHWLGIYDYCFNELNLVVQTQALAGLLIVAQNANWWMPFKTVCYISERPNYLNLNVENLPHCEDGQAIGYPDGWGVYAWRGVRVPEWIIMRPRDITPDKILNEENTEIARVMLERYGQDNFIRDGGFSRVQSDDYGDLYRVEFANGDEPIVAVKVKDASSDREYFLYVPPHVRSAHEGVAWTFGYDNIEDYNPDLET